MLPQLGIVEHVLRSAVEHDLAHLQDKRPVREVQGGDGVLLDDNRRDAEGFDLFERLFDFLICASFRFSSTVSPWMIRRSSGTSPTPICAASWAFIS